MATETLSQDEVDALLKGVNGEPDAPAEEQAPADGIRPYDLAKHERSVRGRMPTLEIVNERFARQLSNGPFHFVRRNAEISSGGVNFVKFSEFLRNLTLPTNLNVMQLRPLRGSALIVIDANIVFAMVDTMFGGNGNFRARIEGREFTATENRVIQRMLTAVTEEYQKAWAPVYALHLEYVRSEMHAQFANIATPSEIVVTSTFKIDLGNNVTGGIHICIPYSALEPIRDLLTRAAPSEHSEPDRRWMRMLSKQVQLAEVELVAPLARVPASVGQLIRMQVGDVIAVDIDDRVTAEVDGIPIFECRYGTLNGRYALKIEKVLAIPQNENSLGE